MGYIITPPGFVVDEIWCTQHLFNRLIQIGVNCYLFGSLHGILPDFPLARPPVEKMKYQMLFVPTRGFTYSATLLASRLSIASARGDHVTVCSAQVTSCIRRHRKLSHSRLLARSRHESAAVSPCSPQQAWTIRPAAAAQVMRQVAVLRAKHTGQVGCWQNWSRHLRHYFRLQKVRCDRSRTYRMLRQQRRIQHR